MTWPSYTNTRDANIQWLDQVPATWTSSRLRALYQEVDQRRGAPADLELLSVSIHTGVQPRSELITDKESRAEDLSNYKVCRSGDIILNRMRAFQGGLGASPQDGIVSPDYMVMRPTGRASSPFMAYLMKTHWFVEQMSSRLRGIGSVDQGNARTPRINPTDLGNIEVPVPPLDSQAQIVRFLDCQTAKIDALIGKQTHLIATLRENRAATITHAVTKGIDRNVETKESGVDWLGDIPVHWNHSFVKFACTTLSGYPFKSEGFSHDPAEVPLLRGANVGVDQIDWTDVVYWPRDKASAFAAYELEQGDIVMGLDRPFISAGIRVSRVDACDRPSLLLQRVLRLRAVTTFDQDYLFYLLTGPGIVHHLTPMFTGVSVPHVSPDQVGSFPLPQPPMAEQGQIVAHLVDRCRQIDELIGKARESVDILGEYRSALITDAITGKIDVRGAA